MIADLSRRQFLTLMSAACVAGSISAMPRAASAGSKPYGSGHFGDWITDTFGLPAYRYTCDQLNDPKAVSPTDAIFRSPTDQFHQLGNNRVVALASNYGYVQLRQDEGGSKFLNDYNPQQGHYAGGIGYLSDGAAVLSTYYPGDAEKFERVFGMGYFGKSVAGSNYRADQVIFAPFGDDPVLISQVTLKNESRATASLTWTEFWGCQTYEFCNFQGGLTHTEQHLERRRVADQFVHDFEVLPGHGGLLERKRFVGLPPKFETGPGGSHAVDLAPPATFLASLGEENLAVCSNGKAFVGSGGIREPDGVRGPLPQDPAEHGGDSALIVQQRLSLAPGETRTLHFLYGYLPDGFAAAELIERYRENTSSLLKRSCAQWKQDGIEFRAETQPWIGRELTWSSYYLRSGLTYDSFFGEHVLSQGHAYQYIEGGSVGGRDMLNHILPFVYTDPDIVKESLRYYCKCLRANGSTTGSHGFGMVQASGLPEEGASDVNLWLFWTVSEYILATRDLGFLDEEVEGYPVHGAGVSKAKVRDYLARAWDFQTRVVGRGQHGLMRNLTGDWNDNIALEGCPPAARAECLSLGESVLDSAMAVYCFEIYAQMWTYAGAPPEQIAVIRTAADSHRQAVRAQWAGRWFRRAWFGPTRGWAGDGDNLWLEPQPWTIIGGVATPEQTRTLVAHIDALLRRPSPIGAMVGNRENTEFGRIGERLGQGEDGGIWPAVNEWLVWALGKVDPAMAWDEWKKNTLARHAEAYPDIWYGIWGGPDTYNSVINKNPGQTMTSDLVLQPKGVEPGAFSYATDFSMVDFPVMNMHPHSATIVALLKLIGAEFTAEGMVLRPVIPLPAYRFATPLLGVTKSAAGYEGWYDPPHKQGVWTIRLVLPVSERARFKTLTVSGKPVELTFHPHGEVVIAGPGGGGRKLSWALRA